MSNTPDIKVSVIIPVYNVEPYLKECLNSIVNQTLSDIEIICINDGSTDNCAAILEEYQAGDSRILIVTQNNRGLSAARNVGMDKAAGKYIHFMDSDDLLQPDALMESFALAEKNDLDVVYFDASVFFESDELEQNYGGYGTSFSYERKHEYPSLTDGATMFAQMSANNEYRSSMCLQFIKLDFLNSHSLRFYEGIYHEDQLFNFLCMMRARRVSHIGKPFFMRRIRDNSIMTESKNYKHFYGYYICFTQILNFSLANSFSEEVMCEVLNQLEITRNSLIKIYREEKDSTAWVESMTAAEQYLIGITIAQSADLLSAQGKIEELNVQVKELTAIHNGSRIAGKIRSGFRCIREYGIIYTVKLIVKKVIGKLD